MTGPGQSVVVVGGGLVGLATARELLARGRPVTVIEAEDGVARHQSGHNSGVIHSGLYYRPGSLKARLCREGGDALYRFCAEHGIACRHTGKLVLATDPEELSRLGELERRGRANGLAGLARLGPDEVRERFPAVAPGTALWVPQTGVVDFPAVARVLARQVSEWGGEVRTGAPLVGAALRDGELVLELGGRGGGALRARLLVNCAGLQSDRVARLAGARPKLRIVPFRGEYLQLVGEPREGVPVPVYPVPDPRFPFLGVHLTPTVDGRVEVGPNAVLAFARHGYRRRDVVWRDLWETLSYPGLWSLAARYWRHGLGEMVRSMSRSAFLRAARRLLPGLEEGDLAPGGSGVRAQALDRRGHLLDDFRIVHGERAIHVLNAPSPAATAALAIGREIAGLAERRLESL